MKIFRWAGVLLLSLLTVARFGAPLNLVAVTRAQTLLPGDEAPLFRVFLKDGSTLISYGELARVNDRVVFSMPTSASSDNPQLQLVDISSSRVDWTRTVNYADAARAARYLATRAELDYTELTSAVAQALSDVSLTSDPERRLAIVERARRTLNDWPPRHFGYKQDEVRQTVSFLDEAIAELRAAIGAKQFDLSLVATVEAPKFVEPLLPAPSAQEAIEQTIVAARLTESPAHRTSLLSVAVAAIDRDLAVLPAAWAVATRRNVRLAIARELQTDRAYETLRSRSVGLAEQRAFNADVRGVQKLVENVRDRDKTLGNSRPDVIASTLALLEDQLDLARRLQLARDRWALRLPDFRTYRQSMGEALQRLVRLTPALDNIKRLAGSGPDDLGAILDASGRLLKLAGTVLPPDELKEAHGLMVSAAQLAESAAQIRREAALTGDMTRAWSASSAAAGALMLSARAMTEMQSALRTPQLPR